MNFEHTEDRRMLADTLTASSASRYPFPTRDKIARLAAGLQPRDLAASSRSSA